MPAAPLTISKPKLLLGEGVDEVRFFAAWLAQLGVSDVQVMDYAGKANLAARRWPSRRRASPPLSRSRDADLNAAGTFASVCSSLSGAGLATPPASR
ncbi:MAG: hypothetical protein L0Z62_44920 [Gemmataceae bacterium]|nr:hypothetical protein [Gemmataceae bacterium]